MTVVFALVPLAIAVGVLALRAMPFGVLVDFLAQGALISSLTLAYFCHHFGVMRNPASTPATYAITCEAFARFVLLVYHGAHAVLSGGTLGAINVVIVVGMSLFGLLNLTKLVVALFLPAEHFRYEEAQRGSGVR